MAYERQERFISSSKYRLKSPYKMQPKYITIHNTANDATAMSEVAYMSRNSSATSFHVAIDDKYAVEAIQFDRNAWHCGDGQGDGNRKSIGIEICFSKSGGERYRQAELNTIEYTAQLLKKYGWGVDRVKWHKEWSGKNCPHRILDEGRANEFRGLIAKRLHELNQPIVKKESVRMFKPSTQTLENEMIRSLELAHKNGILTSDSWAQKAKDGELTLDDAVALTATIVRRTLVESK